MCEIKLATARHPHKKGVMVVRASAPWTPEAEWVIRTTANYIRAGWCVGRVPGNIHRCQDTDFFELLHASLARYEYNDDQRRPWPVAQLLLFEAGGTKTQNLFVQLFRSAGLPPLEEKEPINGTPFRRGDIIVPTDVNAAELLFEGGMLTDHIVIQRLAEHGSITGTSIGLHIEGNHKRWRLATDTERVGILTAMANRKYGGSRKDFDELLFPQLLDTCQTGRLQARPFFLSD